MLRVDIGRRAGKTRWTGLFHLSGAHAPGWDKRLRGSHGNVDSQRRTRERGECQGCRREIRTVVMIHDNIEWSREDDVARDDVSGEICAMCAFTTSELHLFIHDKNS